jgi:hypothetical protein
MIINRRTSLLGVLAALAFGCSAALAAPPKYKILLVQGDGVLPPPTAIYAINDDGVMVGSIPRYPGRFDRSLARYTGPRSAAELLTDSNQMEVADVNAAGDVLGSHQGVVAIWRRDGTRVPMSQLGSASGFNNNGWVVGWQLDGPVIWHDGAATALEVVDDTGGGAADINDAGMSAGSVSIRLGNDQGTHEAAIWDASGKLRRLTIPGAHNSHARDINGRNHVVGVATDGDWFSFFYDGATVTRLPAVNGRTDWSVVTLNDRDEVLGDMGPVDGPALVRKGVGYRLRDLLDDQGKDWLYLGAEGMNNAGDIVGWGDFKGKSRGFIAKRIR